MSNSLKRLQGIEAALEQLLEREKAFVVWHQPVETEEECLQAAIDAGRYNPDTQDLVLIISQIPTKTRYNWDREWTSEIPAPLGKELLKEPEVVKFDAPRFEDTYPEKPEPRRPIRYPDRGIV
jgi:hypothetical protein